MRHSWLCWLRAGLARKPRTATRIPARRRGSFVPQLLMLEDRTVLSVLTVLNNADSGAGSLRDTLAAAQSGDTIVFDPSLASETITLTSGPLALSSNLTINGLGANLLAISGNNASQLFTLSGSAQVTLANLTLTGGKSSDGGAVFIGGTAALTLDNDILSGNQAVPNTRGIAMGGAVYNSAGASLTVENTSFVNNQANGPTESFGGALVNGGSLAINGATFTGNAALGSTNLNQGGAITNLNGATATIKLSGFSDNQALASGAGDASGGAIGNRQSGVTCTVSQCTFANNFAKCGSNAPSGALGGAIEDDSRVNLTVLSCLFIGNQANSGGGSGTVANGGAIDNSVAGTVTISDSQFISNSAIGSGVGASAAGGAVDNYQTMTIDHCLFTGNSAVGGPMPDGMHTFAQAVGGAIETGNGLANGVTTAILTISDSIVAGNEAMGGSGGPTLVFPAVGGGYGGGIDSENGTLNVSGCTITGNEAIGGASAKGSGGFALGGAIDNYQSTLNLKDSTVSTNLCQGGQGPSGAAGGPAFGGGISLEGNSVAILTNCTVSLNECLGGLGGAGADGGEVVGGGIANAVYTFYGLTDTSSLKMSNCALFGNLAQGGTAGSSAVGGDGLGGGLWAGGGTVVLQAVLVSGNQAQGGADSSGNTTGNGLGGGVYVDPSATATADMQTLIAGNHASKGNNDVWGTINIVP